MRSKHLTFFFVTLIVCAGLQTGLSFASRPTTKKNPQPSYQPNVGNIPASITIRLPSGSMNFHTFGKWNWSDSCKSQKVACYFGSLGTSGSGYLFSGPVPPGSSKTSTADLCKEIFGYQSKFSKSVPADMRPRALAIKRNIKGQTYCSWSRGKEWTYFWKVDKSLVSISFSPLDPNTRNRTVALSSHGKAPQVDNQALDSAFWKDVEKFANEVTFVEK